MRELENKVALVTGASRGIGRGIAEALAGDGAMVIIHFGRNSEAADETVKLIASRGGAAFALPADLACAQEIESFFVALDEQLTARAGSNQLDILVNNAGIHPEDAFWRKDHQHLFTRIAPCRAFAHGAALQHDKGSP